MTIATPTGVTPKWLSSILKKEGITAEVISVGLVSSRTLPYSTVYRLAIEYGDKPNNAPGTLFLKLGGPITNEVAGNISKPEVEFYKTVAPKIGSPPLIKCYDAAFDDATGRSHVLMEDLTETHAQPEQNTAPSKEMSRCAIETLAKAHAALWDSPKLGNEIGTVFDGEWLRKFIAGLNKNVAEFSEIADLTGKQKDAYSKMLDAAPKIWGRLLDKNGLTVTHGDLHWWNFLYPKAPNVRDVRLFDWQLWHIDLGARDLAFLLALGGFAEPRPSFELELLRSYHEALGIEGYSWDMLNLDYRTCSIRNLNIPVIFWTQGKHYTTWQTALRRAFESYERLECGELF